jgi:hypothetical protein
MTHAGDVFENPATRETGRIITGAGDTDGRYLRELSASRRGLRALAGAGARRLAGGKSPMTRGHIVRTSRLVTLAALGKSDTGENA